MNWPNKLECLLLAGLYIPAAYPCFFVSINVLRLTQFSTLLTVISGKNSSNVFGLTDSGEIILSPSSDEDVAGNQRINNGSQKPQQTDLPDCDEFTRLLTQDDARMLVDLLKLAVAGIMLLCFYVSL
jgi:hypothetical protein